MNPPATREHSYLTTLTWTAEQGTTSSYTSYSRNHQVESSGKAPLALSSDPNFRGDPACWNPEDLLVASLSSCHMLWYLHLCAVQKIHVLRYEDRAEGVMVVDGESGRFRQVTLRPRVTIAAGADPAVAARLHDEAHRACFIANSVSFEVGHEATVVTAEGGANPLD